MMGQQPPDQNALFYEFCLENHVPQDHLLRQVDPLLDLSDLCEHLTACYSRSGRPSVAPGLLIRILIVGYCYGSLRPLPGTRQPAADQPKHPGAV